VKIISIESNGDEYKGLFTEDYRQYKRFNISPTKYQITPLQTSSNNSSYEEFVALWQKCCESTEFLDSPIEIKELTFETLSSIDTLPN